MMSAVPNLGRGGALGDTTRLPQPACDRPYAGMRTFIDVIPRIRLE